MNNKAFTMIELIFVVAILGIVLMIAIPKIQFTDYELKAEGRRLCSDIRYIRLVRMTEGKLYKIQLKKDGYNILEVSNTGPKITKRVKINEKFEIADNLYESMISFSVDGAPRNRSAGTIKIINNDNAEYCEMTIVPFTGRVLLKDEILKGRLKK